MSDKQKKADEALRRFEERQRQEEAAPVEQADAVAEEMGVEPDEMEVEPGIVRGVFVYELEDGSFGYKNMDGGKVNVGDALMLGSRLVEGARSDLAALKTIQLLKAEGQKAQAQQPRRVLRPMGRRAQ